jgi:hypothetical protein
MSNTGPVLSHEQSISYIYFIIKKKRENEIVTYLCSFVKCQVREVFTEKQPVYKASIILE